MTYIRYYIGHWFGDPLRMVNIDNAVKISSHKSLWNEWNFAVSYIFFFKNNLKRKNHLKHNMSTDCTFCCIFMSRYHKVTL